MKHPCRHLIMLLIMLPTLALGAAPIARLSLPGKQVLVGEPVALAIDILVPGWFTAPLQIPATLVIGQATARLDDAPATNLSERIDGVAYAGMRHTYTVIAQAATEIVVPPVAIGVSFSDGTTPRTVVATAAGLRYLATLPRGAEKLGYFFAASQFHLQDQFDRSGKNIKVGDVLTRSITQTATDVPAMNLPALNFPSIPGLALYADEPRLDDKAGERGAHAQSVRRQTVRYVIEQPGRYTLAGIRIDWFHTASRTMRVARTPPLTIEVATPLPAATVVEQIKPVPAAPASSRMHLTGRLGILAGLSLLMGVIWVQRQRIAAVSPRWQAWKRHRATGPAACFARLQTALRRRESPETISRLISDWLVSESQETATPTEPPGLRQFAENAEEPALALALGRILRAAYGGEQDAAATAADYKTLYTTLPTERRRMKVRRRKPAHAVPLPALNPAGDAGTIWPAK